jgi:hypothetical protein
LDYGFFGFFVLIAASGLALSAPMVAPSNEDAANLAVRADNEQTESVEGAE